MNPIAQTFTITQPQNGVDGVLLTGIDLYFQSVDTTFGVTVQIRDTVNGVPSANVIPHASKSLLPSSGLIESSLNASTPTNFTFDTPVVLQTNYQYAIVVIPMGGNPSYNIWTAQLGETDVYTGNPIYNNNQLGTLFTSSNDLNFTAIPLESMKYNLYTAAFNSTSGTAVYRNSNADFLYVRNIIGTFSPHEKVYVSNSVPAIGFINLQSGYANSFAPGELLFQGASLSTSTANATVYFGNSSFVKFSNLQGSFVVGSIITSANTTKTSNVIFVNQNTATVNSTTISVPDASYSDYSINNYIFLATNTSSNAQILKITAANTTSNTLTVSPNINFTDTNALIGRVRGDANLYGYFGSTSRSTPYASFILNDVTSNSTLNFTKSRNNLLIGGSSGSVATVVKLYNSLYDNITSQMSQIVPNEGSASWGFKGTSNTGTIESSYNGITADIPYEFIDEKRIIMSRSFEVSNTLINSNSSLQTQVTLGTSNTLISPYIDKIRNVVTITHNKITPSTWLNGYTIAITNANNYFNSGDTVWQSNSTVNTSATVVSSNSSYLYVVNPQSSNTLSIGTFIANSTSIITDINTGAVANVTAVQIQNESLNASFAKSRYISKNVILATGQDSEDVITYLGAYRPPGTNLYVYAKVAHSQDSDTFNSKDWSLMPETSSPALQSSLVNTNDLVELTYGLPTSVSVYTSGVVASNTSPVLNFNAANTTAPFSPGQFVYLVDQSYTIANASIASAGSGYTNGDVVQLTGTAGYLNSNATFTVSTNSSGNVVSLTVNSGGIYLSNTTLTAQTTANNTGVGTGLTLGVSNFTQSSKFNVRQIVNVPSTTTLTLSSNTSIYSGNVAIGIIPNLQSQSGAFKYANNNGIIRYVNSSDSVFDTYLTFAIKIVLVSNSSYVVPRISDMRTLALAV